MDKEAQSSAAASPREPSSAVLAAQILTMILENGTSLATQQPRPHSISDLHAKRTALLRDPFFDERHERRELGPRRHPSSPVLFMDMVVLTARLMRVLMRRENERTDADILERVNVRNDCLDQPFFRRRTTELTLPFVNWEEDENYWEGLSEDEEYDCMQSEDYEGISHQESDTEGEDLDDEADDEGDVSSVG